MPELSGVESARRMLNTRSDIPIVPCTGFGETAGEEPVKVLGVRECVVKPIVARELAGTTRRMLQSSGTGEAKA